MNERGQYIVIEGSPDIDKAAQARMLVEQLTDRGIASRYVHEPYELPNDPESESESESKFSPNAMAELLRLTAHRAELFQNEIEPGLEAGKIVVADGNWLSSAMRQGVEQGLGVRTVRDQTRFSLDEAYINPRFLAMLYDPQNLQNHNEIIDDMQPPNQKRGDRTKVFSYIPADGTDEEINERIVAKLTDAKVIPKL